MVIVLFDGDTLCWRASCAKKDITLKVALSAVNNIIYKALNKYDTNIYRVPITSTDRSNFRFTVAKTREYKGNRKGIPKPAQFWSVREHLIRKWGAVEVFGMEADDWLGIEQCYYLKNNRKSVIYANDKDLKQIPGLHCDFEGKEEFIKDPLGHLSLYRDTRLKTPKWKLTGTGLKWFYAQCITGDSCDNIPGLYKKGPKVAFAALNCCTDELQLYQSTLREFGGNEELMDEMAQLCWILKEENEYWLDRKERVICPFLQRPQRKQQGLSSTS